MGMVVDPTHRLRPESAPPAIERARLIRQHSIAEPLPAAISPPASAGQSTLAAPLCI